MASVCSEVSVEVCLSLPHVLMGEWVIEASPRFAENGKQIVMALKLRLPSDSISDFSSVTVSATATGVVFVDYGLEKSTPVLSPIPIQTT